MPKARNFICKPCSKCKKWCSPDEFRRAHGWWCRECHNQWGRENRKRLIKVDRHGRKVTKNTYSNAKKMYGLTAEEYDALIDSSGECGICFRPFGGREPYIDHCHRTKTVRGLLCFPCNWMLGFARDQPEVFQRAINWLAEAN